MSRAAKREIIKELGRVWPKTPAAVAHLSVLKQALSDSTLKKVDAFDRIDAIEYLKTDLWNVELCGIDESYVRRCFKKHGFTVPTYSQDLLREAIASSWKAAKRAQDNILDLAEAHWRLHRLYGLLL